MRWVPLLLVLASAACRTRLQSEREADLYGGVALSAIPDVGATVTAGQILSTRSPRFDYAFEMRATRQGGDDSPTQDGRFVQLHAGVKQIASPGHDRHVVFRYGVVWLRATGDPRLLSPPADYIGLFGGVGYEWDVTRHLTIGPEASFALLNGEGSIGPEFLPQVAFHVLFRF